MSSLPSQPERRPQARRTWIKRSTVVLPLLCLLIFGALIGSRLIGNATGASAASLVPLTGHVPGVVKTSTLMGPTDPNQNLSLSIGLKLRNADALKAYADNTVRSRSTHKPQHLTSAQIAEAFAPLASSQQAVIDYLQGYGFHITNTLSQHLVIDVQGTVADAENAFHIQINNYHSSSGQDFYAPSSNPSIPANLAGLIQSITGLDNVRHFSHPPVKSLARSNSNVTANSVSCQSTNPYTYLPSQFAAAYNLAGFYNAGFKGEGQTVGLIEFDDYNSSDISAYTSCYGGSKVPIQKIKIDGGNGGTGAAPGSGAIEVELDMELVLSAAPDLAGLDVYEAPNSDQGNIDMWSHIINNDAIPIISTSWGSCEPYTTYSGVQEENTLFTIAAAQGQTIVAAAGDHGTDDCAITLNSTHPYAWQYVGVDDPAAQPYVTGVGGTSLTLNSNNSYQSEQVWNNGVSNTESIVWAGGGGVSLWWPMPAWQQGPGVIGSYSGGTPCTVRGYCREVPDVSLNADSASGNGYLLYCTVSAAGCTGESWWSIGGTSAGAPMWAAFIALTNEKILHDGGFTIGFLNPYLYQIDQGVNGTSYANDFHDITVGNNDGLGDGKGVYPATANYDMASGLGSYNALNLANDLEKLANAKNGSRSAPANTTWYFAEGSVGGSFTEYLTILNPSATQTAHVSVQYLFENQVAVTKTYTVAPSTRFTTTVNNDLGIAASAPQQAISAIVTSDTPIVAERPMYFNRASDLSSSGTDVLGATNATSTSFYFAAGNSTQISGIDQVREFITILNPSSTATANVTANFYSNGQVVDTETTSVPPLHRGTIQPTYHGQAAIQVTSDTGVVVERPIYYTTIYVPAAGGTVTGAASTVAASTPGTDWLFAEGHTADNFLEQLVLANFGTSATTATINLEYTNGTVQQVPLTVNAQSQFTFNVNNAYLRPIPGCSCTPTADVSIEVTSAAPIVAERVMYFNYNGSISGVTDVVGEAGPSVHSTYSFAEGYTNNSFQEWLTLQNPNASSEVAVVTLFFDGMVVQKEITLPAHSRTTLNINSIVVPIANVYPLPGGGDGYNVSIDVQALSGTVVVERPLYFKYMNADAGGTDIIGYTGG